MYIIRAGYRSTRRYITPTSRKKQLIRELIRAGMNGAQAEQFVNNLYIKKEIE